MRREGKWKESSRKGNNCPSDRQWSSILDKSMLDTEACLGAQMPEGKLVRGGRSPRLRDSLWDCEKPVERQERDGSGKNRPPWEMKHGGIPRVARVEEPAKNGRRSGVGGTGVDGIRPQDFRSNFCECEGWCSHIETEKFAGADPSRDGRGIGGRGTQD
jgi:hypothetical protein